MFSTQFTSPCDPLSLAVLAEISAATLLDKKSSSFMVSDLATLSEARANHLSMMHQKKYVKALQKSLAGACIIAANYIKYAPKTMHLLVHPNPYKAYALIAQTFYPAEKVTESIAPSAHIAPSATLGVDCFIGHGAYIGNNVSIGNRCKIGVNTFIGDGVVIGDDCRIENNVSIHHTVMGNQVIIYPGACIGQDGFGFASDAEGHYKIPHRGGVVIGNDVSIGANTCIDRGSLSNTVIGDCCRLDNLIQIGHNVHVGKGCILVAQVGISGSCQLGDFVTLSGKVGVSGHVKIGHHATILASSTVIQDVDPKARMGGYPATADRDWHKQTYFLKKAIKRQNDLES
jgi:UDP-3-O-[3-hydroxymyristoyl] glucosamine N-acyltransferase